MPFDIADLPATLVKGRVSGRNLIVDRCPACSRRHTHGYLTSEVQTPYLRGFAHRVPHCGGAEADGFYQIIDFTLTARQFEARLRDEGKL